MPCAETLSRLEAYFDGELDAMSAADMERHGGLITAALCVRFGNRWGYRLMPLFAMPLAAVYPHCWQR